MSNTITYFEDEQSKLDPSLPVVERDAINAILYNPRTRKVLCLDWEKFGWKTFIIGGIEKGEDPVTAAIRETREETGYISIELMQEVGRTRSGYYAAHKKENRISNAVGLLFQLNEDTQEGVKDSEHHKYKWISFDQVSTYLNISSQKYIWEKAQEALKDRQ